MKCMFAPAAQLGGGYSRQRREQFIVCLRMPDPLAVPLLEVTELYPQNCGLNLVETAVPADFLAAILAAGAVIAQGMKAPRQGLGIGDNHAAIPPAAQVFGGIKADAAGISQRTCAAAMIGCSQGLGVVFDYVQGTPPSQFANGIHVG